MAPKSWVPGYRSVVEKRREHGLSGAGITDGVEGITTIKLGKESNKYSKSSRNKKKIAKVVTQNKHTANINRNVKGKKAKDSQYYD